MSFRRQGESGRDADARAARKRVARRVKLAARLGRPQKGAPLGRTWARLAAEVRRRDVTCRRCGLSPGARYGRFPVDHILPRRLCPDPAIADQLDNLAMLCRPCHEHKTFLVEPALYRADLQPFMRYLAQLDATGPVPDGETRAAAYRIARQHMETA